MHTKDRSDYRCMTNKELLEEAKQAIRPDWQELAIALSERLEKEEYNPANWIECPHCGADL